MAAPDFTSAHWFKSTNSNEANACVEVASIPGTTGVRDSKHRSHGPILAFDRELWNGFINKLKSGIFDRPQQPAAAQPAALPAGHGPASLLGSHR
ncbi:DUF397 domain-containing protein [Saccharopolyspora phatthalungensis]|uniref:DUF397 domain-containing protein n=1 Tax=Saccharopolyspora phatthalungensis TaxID=664693 RepID=A0A840QD50_9PSEU|nr:DUF397 domain-containing protein [Saccharopolyspora phatthalungensis]MBB5157821.1 hypothetical protein [Saccharopolyspora phatthalungensis]